MISTEQKNENINNTKINKQTDLNIFTKNSLPKQRTNTVIQLSRPIPVNNNVNKNTSNTDDENKMLWGEPTWILLHTIAEKIKPEIFLVNSSRLDILNIVFNICTNLPCPECSEHAKTYLMTTVNYTNIRSKNELKNMLFNFHNYVNSRKKLPIFSKEQLDEKYSKSVIKNIIYNFFVHYQESSKNPKMISNEIFRVRIIGTLMDWFKHNITNFND